MFNDIYISFFFYILYLFQNNLRFSVIIWDMILWDQYDITRFLLVLDHYKKGVQKTYGTRYNTQARI